MDSKIQRAEKTTKRSKSFFDEISKKFDELTISLIYQIQISSEQLKKTFISLSSFVN